MFFRARSVEPPSAPPRTSQPPDADDALDALASVLRAFGENAFDTDERSSPAKMRHGGWKRADKALYAAKRAARAGNDRRPGQRRCASALKAIAGSR